MALTDAEQKRLRVLVTPAAWAAHEALPEVERVSLEDAFEVHGDLSLVAADVLEAACLKARAGAAGVKGGVKRLRVEGEMEVEYTAGGGADGACADAWCARAAALRAQVQEEASGVPGSAFVEWET